MVSPPATAMTGLFAHSTPVVSIPLSDKLDATESADLAPNDALSDKFDATDSADLAPNDDQTSPTAGNPCRAQISDEEYWMDEFDADTYVYAEYGDYYGDDCFTDEE